MAGGMAEEIPVLGGYRLEDQVGFYLRRAGQRHAAIFAGHMADELTPTQWAALVKLAEHHSVSQNLLGRETAMDAATIKGVVDRLSKRGFVATSPDPEASRTPLRRPLTLRLLQPHLKLPPAGLPLLLPLPPR